MNMRDLVDIHLAYNEYLEEKNKLAALGLAGAMLAGSPALDQGPREPAQQYQSVDSQDLKYLALTMWGEARSHGEEGMRAVGHVIKNRADHQRWEHDIKGVVKARKQFSCWNPGDPNKKKMEQMLEIERMFQEQPEGFDKWEQKFMQSSEFQEYKAYQKAKELARAILKDRDSDPTKGALFYHTTAVNPDWARGQEPIAKVANHVFYDTDRKVHKSS